jgi:FAD:protein FMN transferase
MPSTITMLTGKASCRSNPDFSPGSTLHTQLGLSREGARLLAKVMVGLLCCLLPARAASVELERYEYSADAMGGAFSVTLYSDSRHKADLAASAAFTELHRLDEMLSNYRPESEWSRVNNLAARHPVKISQELFDLLSECLEYSRRSAGAFDITVGPLVKAWGFYKGSGQFANHGSIQAALLHVGYTQIQLDSSNHTVRFTRLGMELDPGGIGKGYAVDSMIGVLKRNGIERALVSAAGSSIYALGNPPGREGWPVSLHNPTMPSRIIEQFMLRDESLSTSGRTEKFFRYNGQVYGHIIDPRTGYPVQGVLLAAVTAPRTLDSEAWTKACYVNGRRWSTQHIPAGFRVFFCEEDPSGSPCGFLPKGVDPLSKSH